MGFSLADRNTSFNGNSPETSDRFPFHVGTAYGMYLQKQDGGTMD